MTGESEKPLPGPDWPVGVLMRVSLRVGNSQMKMSLVLLLLFVPAKAMSPPSPA
jgi:hypothetical protein